MKHFKSILLLGFLAVLFACKQNGDGYERPKTIPIEKIVVQDKTIFLNATNEKITATVLPANANQSVTWASEELQFTTTITPNSPIIDKTVKWELDSSYNESNKIPTIHFQITENGKLKIIDNPSPNTDYYHGKTVRIKAVSLVDDSVVATKVITVYNNLATIERINPKVTEWVHCKESNNSVYNGSNKLEVSIHFADGQNIYKKVCIIENPDAYMYTSSLVSEYLEKTIYDLDNSTSVTLVAKKHTEGREKTFYVFPIDPKTERPSSPIEKKKFKLTIWAEPTGIEIIKGGTGTFDIAEKDDGSYYSAKTLATGNHAFYVKLLPLGATKTEWLSYKLEDPSKKIENVEKGVFSADGNEYTFDINSGSGVIKEATFKFMVKVNHRQPSPAIEKQLKIKYL